MYQDSSTSCSMNPSFSEPSTTPAQKQIEKQSSLTHFFIKQLKIICHNRKENDELTFFGRPVDIVCICGRLMKIDETTTIIKYFVEDNTGEMECIFYLGYSDSAKTELEVGIAVNVYGKIKKSLMDQRRFLAVIAIRQAKEFHEVLFHRLSSIRDAALIEQFAKRDSLTNPTSNNQTFTS